MSYGRRQPSAGSAVTAAPNSTGRRSNRASRRNVMDEQSVEDKEQTHPRGSGSVSGQDQDTNYSGMQSPSQSTSLSPTRSSGVKNVAHSQYFKTPVLTSKRGAEKGLSKREREYNERMARVPLHPQSQSQEEEGHNSLAQSSTSRYQPSPSVDSTPASVNTTSVLSLPSRSNRYRPSNSNRGGGGMGSIDSPKGTLDGTDVSVNSGGFPLSVGAASLTSYEQAVKAKARSQSQAARSGSGGTGGNSGFNTNTNISMNEEEDPYLAYNSEQYGSELGHQNPYYNSNSQSRSQTKISSNKNLSNRYSNNLDSTHSLDCIEQEHSSDARESHSDSSRGSSMSDIKMRPSSSIPLEKGSGNEKSGSDTSEDRVSETSRTEVSLQQVLQRLAQGDAFDEVSMEDASDDYQEVSDDYEEGSEEEDSPNGSRPRIDTGSVTDKSGMTSAPLVSILSPSPSGPKIKKTASWREKLEDTKYYEPEPQHNEDEYYARIRESTSTAYTEEDGDEGRGHLDSDTSGSEDLDVLGNIPEKYRLRGSRDEEDEHSVSESSSTSSVSLSDEDGSTKDKAKTEPKDTEGEGVGQVSPGVVTARAIRPGANKANRPKRKKPAPKPPINPLATKTEASSSASQLSSTNSHSDVTVAARHNAHGASFISGGLRRVPDSTSSSQLGNQGSSVSGGLRRLDDSQGSHGMSTKRMSVSGGLRKVEGGNKEAGKSFFGRSMLMLKALTGNNAPSNASMSSVTDNSRNNTPRSSPPPPSNPYHPHHNNASNSQPFARKNTAQSLLSTEGGESVISVNTVEMKNPGIFLHTRGGGRPDSPNPPSSFSALLDDSKAKLKIDALSDDEDNENNIRGSGDSGPLRDDKVKSEKFQRMMLIKQQYASSRGNNAFNLGTKSNSNRGLNGSNRGLNTNSAEIETQKSMKRKSSMAMMIQKANQLNDKSRPLTPNGPTFINQTKNGLSRKSSAMVMNMQGLGMNMTDISKNLSRTVSSAGGVHSPNKEKTKKSPLRPLVRQHGNSFSSTSDQEDSPEGEDTFPEAEDKDSLLEDNGQLELELDCGPNLENPILSYKQAQRVRAFHMPGLIDGDTMTLIQHPMNSKFGWFEFPFRKIFAKDPSPSDMVIEKYGIGVILWFRFLKAFAIVFLVMFVVNVPAMSMFYHGTYYPAARTEERIDNSPTDILTTTTMGNLGVQLQYCHVVQPGEELHIDCFGGIVENIIAYYGTPSGQCSCPSVQQPKKNGACPGNVVLDETTLEKECEVGQYNKKLACYSGTFRREKCCGFELEEGTGDVDLSALGLAPDYSCNSLTAQYIANGMCLGKERCSLYTDNNHMYSWKGAAATNLNNSDVCQFGFDSGASNSTASSYCNTTMGYSGIFDTCGEEERSLKVNVKCSEKDISAFGAKFTRPSIVLTASILNALAVSTFIFAVFWVSKQQEKEDAEMDQSTCRATDYTIRVVRLPEHNSASELALALKKHFESKLSKCKPCFLPGKVRVADINLTTGSFQYLQAAINRGKASRALDLVHYKKAVMDYLDEEKSWRYKFFEKWEEHALYSFDKYNQICLRKFRSSLNGERKVIVAYVTFETEEGFLRALDNNIPLHGKQMQIRRAEDPSDILWENLGTPVLQRIVRRTVTTVLLIVLLLMTYFIVAFAIQSSESNSTDWPFIITCDDFIVSTDIHDNSTELNVITYEKTLRDHKWQYYNNTSGRQGYVNCYCKAIMNEGTIRRALDYHFYDAEEDREERWCKSLLWDNFYLLMIKLAVSIVVLTVNLSAKTILHVLKEFERMASYSLISQSMTLKLFMIQIVNTGMLALLMNGDAGLSKDNSIAFLNGDYEDFTPEWYNDIGKTVLQTITLYNIGVHGMKFAVHFRNKFLRWRDRGFGSDIRITKQVSQENLNKLFLGPEFVIEVRYATVLTVCFVCIAYAPAMPLLYLIGAVGFWATYMLDKWFFLRVYRIPKAGSPALAHTVTKSLYFSAILNLVLSIWIYSNIMLFDPVVASNGKEVVVDGLKFLEVTFSTHSYEYVSERVFSKYAYASWIVLIPFLFFLFILFLTHVMNEYNYKGGAILSRLFNLITTERMFEGNPPYFNVIPATLLVRRLEDGIAKPHILDAYEKQLQKIQVEGEEDKLMEGLESYKIELNEIYADKIAINSDHMSKVRPIDLFAEDDQIDGGCKMPSEDYSEDEEVDAKKKDAGNKANPTSDSETEVIPIILLDGKPLTRKRSGVMGRGLSGADYEWVDTEDINMTPTPTGENEKDIFTLLKEKKKEKKKLKLWQKQKNGGGSAEKDEVKQQSDSSSDDTDCSDDNVFSSDEDDDSDEEVEEWDSAMGMDKNVSMPLPIAVAIPTSTFSKQPSSSSSDSSRRQGKRKATKGNGGTGSDRSSSTNRDNPVSRDKDLPQQHSVATTPNTAATGITSTSRRTHISNRDRERNRERHRERDREGEVSGGESRRFRRRSNHHDSYDKNMGEVVKERRYYDLSKESDRKHQEQHQSEGRGGSSDARGRDRRTKDKPSKSRRDHEGSVERKHHRDKDRDKTRDKEKERDKGRDRDPNRVRDREEKKTHRESRSNAEGGGSGGDRNAERDRRRHRGDRDRDKDKDKVKDRSRDKDKDKNREKVKEAKGYSSPSRSRRERDHSGSVEDKPNSKNHKDRRGTESRNRSPGQKEMELGFLAASKNHRQEVSQTTLGGSQQDLVNVSASFSNLFN